MLACGLIPGAGVGLATPASLEPGNWQPVTSFTLSNSFLTVPEIINTNNQMFFRVKRR